VFKWIGIGLGVITLLIIGFIVALAIAPVPVREAFRDIFIIILGFFMLISTVLTVAVLMVLLYTFNRIEQLARGNVIPKVDQAMLKLNDVLESTKTLANNARDSSSTVTGSTTFVAERVVSPVIRMASLATGVRAAATSLARRDLHDDPDQPLT
jgi:hydrogenase/urease accessory protein HupE